MNEHGRKMIAPIIITVLVLLEVLGFALFPPLMGFPWQVTAVSIAIGLIIAAVVVAVLVSRIKEIRSGEEDDLSKY